MPFLYCDNEKFFFTVKKRDFPRNVLLVHGAGADQSHWPIELMDLPGCSVYFLDLPGHGKSAGPGKRSIAEYAEAVAGFVTTLGLSRVALCGHSMGGAIVQTLALNRPGWLEGIVLVGSGSRLRVTAALLEQLENDFPAAVAALCQALFGPAATPAMIRAEQARYLATDWRLIHTDMLACNGFDVTDRLSQIKLPALVVTGDADTMTPLKYGQFLRDNIAGAQLVVIPGAGHMVACEKPEEFSQAVTAFLQSMP